MVLRVRTSQVEAHETTAPPKDGEPVSGETNRRQQLLEVAYNLIAARGFEGLRFSDVAAQAGINNATLWYYFPSKEALIQGVTEFLTERLRKPQAMIAPSPSKTAVEELRQMFAELRLQLKEDPSYFVVITELALRAKRDPVVDKIGRQRDDFWARRVTGVLERGVAEGVFREDLVPRIAALTLMTQMKGIAHHAAMRERDPAEIDAIAANLIDQVEHWLTCRAGQPSTEKKKPARQTKKRLPIRPIPAKTHRTGS